MIVVDASVVVSALVDRGSTGRWSEEVLRRGGLVAAGILGAEVANVLRRAEASAEIATEVAGQAFHDLMDLPVRTYAFDVVSERAWSLRRTVSPYDAWYVALAEALDAPLATLDGRLARATGPKCEFLIPRDGEGEHSEA